MTPEQIKALKQLDIALFVATNLGLLDIVQGYVKCPDSINDMCDAVEETIIWMNHDT